MTTHRSTLNPFWKRSRSWRCISLSKHLVFTLISTRQTQSHTNVCLKCSQETHDALLKDQTSLIEDKTLNVKYAQEFQQRADNARKRMGDEKINQTKIVIKEQVRHHHLTRETWCTYVLEHHVSLQQLVSLFYRFKGITCWILIQTSCLKQIKCRETEMISFAKECE